MIEAGHHMFGAEIEIGPKNHARLSLQKGGITGVDVVRSGLTAKTQD